MLFYYLETGMIWEVENEDGILQMLKNPNYEKINESTKNTATKESKRKVIE